MVNIFKNKYCYAHCLLSLFCIFNSSFCVRSHENKRKFKQISYLTSSHRIHLSFIQKTQQLIADQLMQRQLQQEKVVVKEIYYKQINNSNNFLYNCNSFIRCHDALTTAVSNLHFIFSDADALQKMFYQVINDQHL